MNVNRTLTALLHDAWLIEPGYAQAALPSLTAMLNRSETPVPAVEGMVTRSGREQFEMPFAIVNGVRMDAHKRDPYTWEIIWTWNELPAGAVAVIPVIGPIVKYNGACGEQGSQARLQHVAAAANAANIAGIIMLYDTPGGQVSGTSDFALAVSQVDKTIKPVVSLVDDTCCSAGIWKAAAGREIYAIQKLATIGSIGVFTTLINATGAYEKLGYQVVEIYAPESDEKNKEWREAMKNRPQLMEAKLSVIAQSFRSWITERRGDRLKSDAWQKGATFFTDEAIQIGLIDGQLSLEQAADRVLDLAESANPPAPLKTGPTSTNTTDMKFEQLAKEAAAGTVSDAAIDAANGELTVAGITSVTLVREKFIEDAAAVSTENATLKTQLETLKTELATANTDKATAEGKVTTLNTQVTDLQTKLAAAPAAAAPAAKNTDPVLEEDESAKEMAELPHNKAIANNPLFN